MIINIRGTSGSGKSHAVKALMSRFPVTPYDPALPGHVLNGSTLVIGPYLTGLATEGTDVVNRRSTQDELERIVEHAFFDHVIFEGLLVSGIYARWRDLALRSPDYRWVFLDTPLLVCLENVRRRRVAAGRPPDFDHTRTVSKHREVEFILWKARADGLRVWVVSADGAADLIAEWIA